LRKWPEVNEVHTLSHTGLPASFFREKKYRDYLGWLLLNEKVRDAFESVHKSMMTQQSVSGGFNRWLFSFDPPVGIEGDTFNARGHFRENRFLVYELTDYSIRQNQWLLNAIFYHPDIKCPVKGSGKQAVQISQKGMSGDLDIDNEENPNSAGRTPFMDDALGSFDIVTPPKTRLGYSGERPSVSTVAGRSPQIGDSTVVASAADDVMDGEAKAIDFDPLVENPCTEEILVPSQFVELHGLLQQMANQKALTATLLPRVNNMAAFRGTYAARDVDGQFRKFLIAAFRNEHNQVRYVLEIDTSDKGKLATKVFQVRAGCADENVINSILANTLAGYLRWPKAVLDVHCSYAVSVKHPKKKEMEDKEAHQKRLNAWRERLVAAVVS
jgi:hypothetical protein